MNQNLAKNVRRLARLELRSARIGPLTARATKANDTAQVERLGKESKRRAAEMAYLGTRLEADLEDADDATVAQASALRDAVLAGSSGSAAVKAIMSGAAAAA